MKKAGPLVKAILMLLVVDAAGAQDFQIDDVVISDTTSSLKPKR